MPSEEPPAARIPRVRQQAVRPRDRWIYSAGFNVADPSPGPYAAPASAQAAARIDAEAGDLAWLVRRGARVAILSHQGDFGQGTARHLDQVAARLTTLGIPTTYVEQSMGVVAEEAAAALAPGTAVLLGNTRQHAGEQANDPALAAAFARLGERVAMGGFSKFHRSHASNVGILEHLPGFLADGVAEELALLHPWSGRDHESLSVLALGGTKSEKTLIGLARLAHGYDLVVPGGAVLNHVLVALGHDVGDSWLGSDPDACVAAAARTLAVGEPQVVLPERVVVAPAPHGRVASARTQPLGEPVPRGWRIVDFDVPREVSASIAAAPRVRALMAGTPCLHAQGHQRASRCLLGLFSEPHVRGLLLGGDTTSELEWAGRSSTGGGSALDHLAHGSSVVLDALRDNHSTRRMQCST